MLISVKLDNRARLRYPVFSDICGARFFKGLLPTIWVLQTFFIKFDFILIFKGFFNSFSTFFPQRLYLVCFMVNPALITKMQNVKRQLICLRVYESLLEILTKILNFHLIFHKLGAIKTGYPNVGQGSSRKRTFSRISEEMTNEMGRFQRRHMSFNKDEGIYILFLKIGIDEVLLYVGSCDEIKRCAQFLVSYRAKLSNFQFGTIFQQATFVARGIY